MRTLAKTIRSVRRRLAIRGEFLRVIGYSMSPTLRPGEIVFVNRRAYRCRAPRRGDVVVARPAACARRLMIKRVAGLPSERVELAGCAWHLGDDEFFLLGDHPTQSTDSRSFGPIQRHELIGPVSRLLRLRAV